jgi:stress response protein SCP2
MTTLAKGANVAVDAAGVRAELSWRGGPGVPDVDCSALLLHRDGRVAGDADFVFYNQAQHPSGSVRHAGKRVGSLGPGSLGTADAVEVDLRAVPPDVERVVLAASADGGSFGQVPELRLVLSDLAGGTVLAEFPISAATETAMISGELYRRDGRWKFRAVGQGYASGLAGLAADFGITVDDAPAPPAAPAPAPPPVAPPAQASGRPLALDAPNLDGGRVSLVKGARVSLVKTGAPPLVEVMMGLGWDPAKRRAAIDLDASVIAFDARGEKLAMVWFVNKGEWNGALRHGGDSLTGEGAGDDEQIYVDLDRLPGKVASLIFTITSYRGQRFTEVKNAFCRLVEVRTGAELVRYDLSTGQNSTGVVMAALRRTGRSRWEMQAIGEFHDGRTVSDLLGPATRHAAGGALATD